MANDTKYITLENLTRLASKIKADIQLKQDQLQFAELPDATTCSGKVVQYIGDDTAELKAGAFYKSDGTTWVQVSVTETPEPVEQTLALVNSLPAWADADASKVYAVKSPDEVKGKTAVYTIVASDPTTVNESELTLCDDNSVTPNPDAYMVHVFNEDTTEEDLSYYSKLRFNPTRYQKELCYMPSNDHWYFVVPVGELSLYSDQVDRGYLSIASADEDYAWFKLSGDPYMLYSTGEAITMTKLDHAPTYEDLTSTVQPGDAHNYIFVVHNPGVPAENSITFYVKNSNEQNVWYTVQTGSTAQPVDLPTFTAISDADIEAAFEG